MTSTFRTGLRSSSGHNATIDARFSETIRLPQPWFGMLVGYGAITTAALAVLWSVVSLTTTERVVLGLMLVCVAGLLLGGPLWYIAMHVEVENEVLRRRVGHRRRRIPVADIMATRIDPSTGQYRLDRLVLTLADGSEYPVTTRRAQELAAAIHPWRAPRISP